MLPFGEAWTGSLIHRRSDTLYDCENQQLRPPVLAADRLCLTHRSKQRNPPQRVHQGRAYGLRGLVPAAVLRLPVVLHERDDAGINDTHQRTSFRCILPDVFLFLAGIY